MGLHYAAYVGFLDFFFHYLHFDYSKIGYTIHKKPYIIARVLGYCDFLGKKYQVYRDVAGKYRFGLLAENNKIIAVGEAYEQHQSCINGIKSIQNNCRAQVEDATVEGPKLVNPKYQLFYDKSCGYRFHLTARNGEIIAKSEGYETKDYFKSPCPELRDYLAPIVLHVVQVLQGYGFVLD